MLLIGCDYHTRSQQIAMVDTSTGEVTERRLEHENGEARGFYASLPGPARVGMEATMNAQWFERLLAEYHHELWVGDAAKIRAAEVRKQKTDARDALHILDLIMQGKFPKIWMPSSEERDLRQLLRHRNKLVGFRTSLQNQLHALAMSQGVCRKRRLWTQRGRQELEGLPLDPWASRRRQELLQFLDRLNTSIEESDKAVEKEAARRPEAVLLMQQPGIGPVTALAFVLTVGPIARLANSRKLVSYLGLNPSEDSSGGRQRLGAISKQGNTLMRHLMVEAAQAAARYDPKLRREYLRLKFRRGITGVARVALARKLVMRLYWKLRAADQPRTAAHMQGSPRNPMVDESPSVS